MKIEVLMCVNELFYLRDFGKHTEIPLVFQLYNPSKTEFLFIN
jgi:hypothetical protein